MKPSRQPLPRRSRRASLPCRVDPPPERSGTRRAPARLRLTLSVTHHSRLHPGRVILRHVELLELGPRGDGSCPCGLLIACEEIGDEVDVATVRDPLESLHLVQEDVLPYEIAVRDVLAA